MQTINSDEHETAAEYGAKTAKIASFVLISKIFTFLATGLSLVLVARILGPSSYGVYTLALAVSGLFGAFGPLGFDVTIVKFVAEKMHRKDTAGVRAAVVNVFAILALFTGIAAVVAILLSGFIANSIFHNALYANALRLAALTIIFGPLWGTAYSVLIAMGKGRSFTGNVFVQSTAQAVLSVLLAMIGFGALAPILGLLLGQICGFLIAARSIAREVGIKMSNIAISFEKWREMFKFTLPIGLSGTVANLVMSLSLVALGYYATSAVIGNYGVTAKMAGIFDVAIGSIGTALLPLFSAVLSDKKSAKNIGKYYNYALYFSLLFAVPVVFYVIGLAQQVAITMFSATYSLAPLYFAIMSLGILVYIPTMYATNLLVGAGKSQKIMKYNLIVAAIQLLLILVLIPTLSGLGASLLNFIIVPALLGIFYIRRAHYTFKMRPDLNVLGRVIGAGILSALAIIPLRYYFGGYYVPLLVAAAVEQMILYPIILALIGGIDTKRIEILRRITKGIPIGREIIYLLTAYTSIFLRR